MAFDGNGNWISDFSAVADRDADIKILASRFDGIFITDIASSFENCLTKDGQVKTQTNFNANNYRVINVANPTGNKDAVNLQTLNSKDSTAVHKTGNETIAGTKTFSSTISGSITGNAGTVTNGVYTTGNQTIGGTKTFSSTISGSISGNAGTVTNGVYTTGTQTIAGSKTFSGTLKAVTKGNTDRSTNVATTAFVGNILSALYPVGSLYIGTQTSCPLATLISGSTWTLVAKDKALWTGDGTNGNTTKSAGLPNITGKTGASSGNVQDNSSGAFSLGSSALSGPYAGNASLPIYEFDASKSNAIYGASTTVQPPAYVVNVWRRTA